MSTGRSHCSACGADVMRAVLFDRSGHISLDPKPVVGGDYKLWYVLVGASTQLIWRAAARPSEVSPPPNMPDELRDEWDGKLAADSRKWYVPHECGKPAEKIAARLTKRRATAAQNNGVARS